LKAVPCGTQGVADEWCILLKNIIYQSGKTTNTNTNTNTTNNTNTNTNGLSLTAKKKGRYCYLPFPI